MQLRAFGIWQIHREVADAVRAHLDAGADHVCLQPVGHGPLPLDDYRALAKELL